MSPQSPDSGTQPLKKSGYISDYISGKDVRATPEETDATQPFAQILVNDYHYEKAQIITHPQYFVKKSPSDTRGSFPVDIAVFKTPHKRDNELYMGHD